MVTKKAAKKAAAAEAATVAQAAVEAIRALTPEEWHEIRLEAAGRVAGRHGLRRDLVALAAQHEDEFLAEVVLVTVEGIALDAS